MAKKKINPDENEKPRVHKELEGFDIQINSFGEITTSFDIDKINQFLNKTVDDKNFVTAPISTSKATLNPMRRPKWMRMNSSMKKITRPMRTTTHKKSPTCQNARSGFFYAVYTKISLTQHR